MYVTEGDGNHLFWQYIVFSIITNLHLLSGPHKQLLKNVGIDPSLDEKNIADQLSSVMVRELIENSLISGRCVHRAGSH